MDASPRPTSHRWVIGLYVLVACVIILILIRVFGRASSFEFWRVVFACAALLGVAAGFLSMCFGGRHRWVYYLNSVMLLFFAVRICQLVYLLASFRLSHPPEEILFSFSDLLFYSVAASLFILLAWRFILGHANRRYFGLDGSKVSE